MGGVHWTVSVPFRQFGLANRRLISMPVDQVTPPRVALHAHRDHVAGGRFQGAARLGGQFIQRNEVGDERFIYGDDLIYF